MNLKNLNMRCFVSVGGHHTHIKNVFKKYDDKRLTRENKEQKRGFESKRKRKSIYSNGILWNWYDKRNNIETQSTDDNLEENNLPYKFSNVRRLTSFLNNDGAVLEIFSDDFRREDSKTGLKWVKYNIFWKRTLSWLSWLFVPQTCCILLHDFI